MKMKIQFKDGGGSSKRMGHMTNLRLREQQARKREVKKEAMRSKHLCAMKKLLRHEKLFYVF